jgi:hypothetical protein
MSHRRCHDEESDLGLALRKLAFDPSLCAENGEPNTEGECLPLAAELLATCRAGENPVSQIYERKRDKEQLTSSQLPLGALARTPPA